VLGDIALARGREIAARRAYQTSIAMLSEMGARGELALSQRALGDLDHASAGMQTTTTSAPDRLEDKARGNEQSAPPRRRGRPPRAASSTRPNAQTQRDSDSRIPGGAARARRLRATDTSAIDAIVSSYAEGASIVPLLRETPDAEIAFTIPEEGWAFLTRDPLILYLIQRLRAVAPLEGTVLLLGETGTGKEMLARLVHAASGRKGAFVAANASAFPDTLVESELFGHIRGAFTGAAIDKKGLFEVAQGGTFFLDEVGDLPMPTQAKLLRTLEERAVRRVGATESRRIDVRFVAATNVDLRHEMEAGRFRRDLYYRLAAHEFDIPPLRKRGSDILLLARDMLARRARQCNKRVSGIDVEAARALLAHRWSGNVRELDNEMQRAATLIPNNGALTPSHLSSRVRAALDADPSREGLVGDVEQLERTRIEAALAATGGNQARAGALLGMSRQLLRYKLMKYQLKPRPKR
jgi:transcriptional regulator with PAS, ATPase and Fis domain